MFCSYWRKILRESRESHCRTWSLNRSTVERKQKPTGLSRVFKIIRRSRSFATTVCTCCVWKTFSLGQRQDLVRDACTLAAAQNESAPSSTKQKNNHARWLSGNHLSKSFFMDCVGQKKTINSSSKQRFNPSCKHFQTMCKTKCRS